MAQIPAEPAAQKPVAEFKPYIPANQEPKEFTPVAILFGSLFGVLFGASTVYLALKAGLTVSASIPIAVIAISVLRAFKSTILENNIVQTIGSAGESVAAGVAFTIPALIFLSPDSKGADYFQYITIMTLAACGGILGVLFMVPLRRSLIVGEHGVLPYPEGTACADVLVAGEKGGNMARLVFGGVGLAFVYKLLNSVFGLWAEATTYVTKKAFALPNATVSAEVSPEYLGVGYILGPKVGGIMVAGGVLSWMVLIPLLSLLLPEGQVVRDLIGLDITLLAKIKAMLGLDVIDSVTNAAKAQNLLPLADLLDRCGIAEQTAKAGGDAAQLASIQDLQAGLRRIANWNEPKQYYEAYVRYIGAGAVTMAGIITLVKTMPTIWRSLVDSFKALGKGAGAGTLRTERDIPIWVVGLGALALAGVIAVLPILPDTGSFGGKLVMSLLILVFGFLFVTVSSRIVGLIGSSSNPISGMTIATLLGTALVFLSLGMNGPAFQPIALSVGAIVCIAAANAGATSQDLKTGYLVGATPIRQQVGLVIGVLVSTIVIGLTVKGLDVAFASEGTTGHGIGTARFPAPQANLMATVIKGVLAQNLPWGYILVGAGLAFMVFLSGVSPLAWAVGAYLPLGTTMPIFVGGMLRALADKVRGEKDESEISAGTLFATGLVAGGTLTGVASAALKAVPIGDKGDLLATTNALGEHFQASLGIEPNLLALAPYALMATVLVVIALKKMPALEPSKT